MISHSRSDFETQILASTPDRELPARCYQKSIYISAAEFRSLAEITLDFSPFDGLVVYQSGDTHRLYAGNINLAGHGARFEIRPLRKSDLESAELLTRLYDNFAEEMGKSVDRNLNYPL